MVWIATPPLAARKDGSLWLMGKWEMVRLGDVCIIERGGSPRPIDKYITDDKDGVNWIKIGDTTPNSMYITQTKEKIIPKGMKKSRYVKPGDFLLSNSMSFGRPYILKIEGCIHDGWLVIRDESNIFDKRFLFYYLSSDRTNFEFKGLVEGGVVSNLNSKMVRDLFILLPPLPIQQKIANILDRASSLIDKRKAQIEKLDLLVKSQFIEMFGESTNSEIKRLDNLCELKPGKFVAATEIKTDFEEGLYPCYGGNGLRGYVDKYSHEGCYPLIGRQGALCGNVQYVVGKFYATEHAVVATPKINIYTLWLSFALRNQNLNKLATGAAQPGLTVGKLNDVKIGLPPINRQKRFADFVCHVDKSKFELQQRLEKLEILYKSLTQKCFIGEIYE